MSQTDANRAKRRQVALFRTMNRLIRPLLASPLHGILSSRLMLLTYIGRKSGRRITIPIGYFDWEPGTVMAMSSTTTWVSSLRDGPTVRLRIRGRDHDAVPTVLQDTETFARFVEGSPGAARITGLPADRKPTPEELHAAAQRAHLVRFRLATA
ncbi:nitroreductase/quinone reductase family protein [Promicromonospora soli]